MASVINVLEISATRQVQNTEALGVEPVCRTLGRTNIWGMGIEMTRSHALVPLP